MKQTCSWDECPDDLDGVGRYCLKHRAEYMRNWRKSHPMTAEQRRKDRCRSHTRMLVLRGQIERQPCWCGAEAEAHHPDYDQPRLVVWLCRPHHLDVHHPERIATANR